MATDIINKKPRSNKFIPYGRQSLDDKDIQAVVAVLRSDYLTTGPQIGRFEQAVADFTGASHAVAVSSGTAALHAAMHAINIEPGDEVILSPMTFAATANAIVYQKGKPVFADIDPDTLLIRPEQAEKKITSRTKAIVAIDYAGHPCDYDTLRSLSDRHGLILISDACHALGAEYDGKKAGTLADLTVFSFHPVKHITTGEGGMIVTNNAELAERMRRFRNHGIGADHNRRSESGTWHYEMTDLGYNYRLTDIQCALGFSQLQRLPEFLQRRYAIAGIYDRALEYNTSIRPLSVAPNVRHAYHLYVVKIDFNTIGMDRKSLFTTLRDNGIGVNVHYIPVHLHPYYQKTFGTGPGLCPEAENAYESILSLPIHAAMKTNDAVYIMETLRELTDLGKTCSTALPDQLSIISNQL